jgi:superoxide dismutase, Fe-Mn family
VIKIFELPKLKYEYNELEPHIDAQTMEIHHCKHHAGYTKNFNAALDKAGITADCAKDVITKLKDIPDEHRTAIRNNGGGYVNHKIFWKILSPNGGGLPNGELLAAIEREFGSFDEFKEKFETAAKTRFGSGWAWLSLKKDGKLCVCSTQNQDNPIMDVVECQGYPIMGLDVWEHAYYLKYQNKRPDYVKAFWNVVNWFEASKRYEKALKYY